MGKRSTWRGGVPRSLPTAESYPGAWRSYHDLNVWNRGPSTMQRTSEIALFMRQLCAFIHHAQRQHQMQRGGRGRNYDENDPASAFKETSRGDKSYARSKLMKS